MLLGPHFPPQRTLFRGNERNESFWRRLFLHTLILMVDLDDPFAEGIGNIGITRNVQGYAYRNI